MPSSTEEYIRASGGRVCRLSIHSESDGSILAEWTDGPRSASVLIPGEVRELLEIGQSLTADAFVSPFVQGWADQRDQEPWDRRVLELMEKGDWDRLDRASAIRHVQQNQGDGIADQPKAGLYYVNFTTGEDKPAVRSYLIIVAEGSEPKVLIYEIAPRKSQGRSLPSAEPDPDTDETELGKIKEISDYPLPEAYYRAVWDIQNRNPNGHLQRNLFRPFVSARA